MSHMAKSSGIFLDVSNELSNGPAIPGLTTLGMSCDMMKGCTGLVNPEDAPPIPLSGIGVCDSICDYLYQPRTNTWNDAGLLPVSR
jgi:hypothetical protein